MAGPISPDTRRAQAARASRAQLLLTAREVFADLGYNEATMRLIAKRAGLSTGSIFNNWTGKEALYREATGRAPPTQELVEVLVSTLQEAAKTFRRYEQMHADKGTVDGAHKAAANAWCAKECECAIAQAQGARP